MNLYYTDHFELPLPDSHQFPMTKYRLLRQRVAGDSTMSGFRLCVPAPATDQQLLRVHTADYVARVCQGRLADEEIRRIGFPWSESLVERSRRSVGATIQAARDALTSGTGGISINLAGGTHHAFADRGAGYCVFNDVAVAIREVQQVAGVSQVAVIDCDAHQGDGTAGIFQADPSVFTFSLHAARAFPARKQTSDLDVALSDGTQDAPYLQALRDSLQHIERHITPDLVFYVAGADPYEHDRLGRLAVTSAGLAERDAMVLDWIEHVGAAAVIVMAGGYCSQVSQVSQIVDIHHTTIRLAVRRAVSDRR